MKKLAFLCLVLSFQAAQAQQYILDITEIDQNGREHTANTVTTADINSDIRIKINQSKLRHVAGFQLPPQNRSAIDSLLEKTKLLQELWVGNLQLLKNFEQYSLRWSHQAEEQRNVESLLNALGPLDELILKVITFAEAEPVFYDLLNRNFKVASNQSSRVSNQYQAILQTTETYARKLTSRLTTLLEQNKVKVRLAAWINSRTGRRSIHLPGFDTFSEGERYEVERFSFLLSRQQQQEINAINRIADTVQRIGLPATFAKLDESLLPPMQAAFQKAKTCVTQIDSAGISDYRNLLNNLIDKYQQPKFTFSSEASLSFEAKQDLIDFAKKTKDRSTSSPCLGDAVTIIENLLVFLEGLIETRRTTSTVYSFSKEVIAHDLENLPQETRFSLLYTGRRDEGDILSIRLGIETPGRAREQLLEHRDLRLYKVLGFLETKVSMAFVNHLDSTGADRKQFQLAPSYSLLMKWGSRTKPAFNRLWRPGFGLNIAAPDFELDEAPDIAISLTGSWLNDWVQLGGGYNITGESPYWFFGLRLPLLSLTPLSTDAASPVIPEN